MALPNTYVIAACSSESNTIYIEKFASYLPPVDVKKRIIKLIKEDKKNDKDNWDGGSTRLDSLEVQEDGTIIGYGNYSEYHINYVARPESTLTTFFPVKRKV